jgi:hypothetical protein
VLDPLLRDIESLRAELAEFEARVARTVDSRAKAGGQRVGDPP